MITPGEALAKALELDARARIRKAGRVLSSKNETAIRDATALLEGVLNTLPEPTTKGDGETVACPGCGKQQAEYKSECDGCGASLTAKSGAGFAVTKYDDEQRRTTGVLYVPNQRDYHNEFATQRDLEDAVAEYVKAGDLKLRLQHDSEKVSGQLIGIIAWPSEEAVTLKCQDGAEKTVTLPAGTVYATAEWDKAVWPDVKKGKIGGFSLGGIAVRVSDAASDDELKKMGE